MIQVSGPLRHTNSYQFNVSYNSLMILIVRRGQGKQVQKIQNPRHLSELHICMASSHELAFGGTEN